MPLPAGTYRLGPENGTLSVRTGRIGAAAMAGHDLLLDVTAWQATLEVGEDPAETSLALEVDGASLRVLEGTGGMQELGPDDKAGIEQTIDDEILKRGTITFRSTEVEKAADGSRLRIRGELTLAGTTAPLSFLLAVAADGSLSGSAVVTQSTWGMTPYSTLFGALKVADEVEVAVDAGLQPRDRAAGAALRADHPSRAEAGAARARRDLTRVGARPPSDLRGLRLAAERASRPAREARPLRAGTRRAAHVEARPLTRRRGDQESRGLLRASGRRRRRAARGGCGADHTRLRLERGVAERSAGNRDGGARVGLDGVRLGRAAARELRRRLPRAPRPPGTRRRSLRSTSTSTPTSSTTRPTGLRTSTPSSRTWTGGS